MKNARLAECPWAEADTGLQSDWRSKHVVWLVAGCYLLLTWVFWGVFVRDRGLHAETIWIELSQTRPGWEGFLYPYDPSRPFMSLPFHLAYLLSDGSYFSLHLLFGVFVWLTGFLTYLLVKNFLPAAEFLSFVAGAIAMTHGGDGSINLLPMIVVRQAVVCILIGILLFRIAWQTGRAVLFIPVTLAQGVSLWTYEPGLLPLLFGPVLIYQKGVPLRRFVLWGVAWSAVPMLHVASLFVRYILLGKVSYQSKQLAGHWSVSDMITTLWSLITHGLAFWRWPVQWFRLLQGCVSAIQQQITVPLVIGALGFAACALIVRRLPQGREAAFRSAPAFLVSLFCLVLAYLPFLTLGGVGAWRTQFYAAVPASIVLAVAVLSIDRWLHGRSFLAVVLCTAVVASGLWCGLVSQIEQSQRWTPYRKVMSGIVQAAPRLRDDTFVALVGTPAGYFRTLCKNGPPNPPFEDTMWFNSALQVLYPNTRLVGIFWGEDGVSPGSIQYKFDANGTRLDRATVTVKRAAFGYDQVIAFAYDAEKGAVLLPSFPWTRIPGSVLNDKYDPMKRVLPGPPPKETLRKLAR